MLGYGPDVFTPLIARALSVRDLRGCPGSPVTGRKCNERGQALIELGIIVVLFMTIALGLITFAHGFMVVNVVTHAARDGARLAATWRNRGACGSLSNTGAIVQAVNNEIAQATSVTLRVRVFQNPQPSTTAPCPAPPQTANVQVRIDGCVPYAFPILPVNFGQPCSGGQLGWSIDRSAYFADEGLGG